MYRKPHEVSGKLAGTHEKLLAFGTTFTDAHPKNLMAVLYIEADNAWHVLFRVSICGDRRMYDGLAKAVRAYDQDEHTEEGRLPV